MREDAPANPCPTSATPRRGVAGMAHRHSGKSWGERGRRSARFGQAPFVGVANPGRSLGMLEAKGTWNARTAQRRPGAAEARSLLRKAGVPRSHAVPAVG